MPITDLQRTVLLEQLLMDAATLVPIDTIEGQAWHHRFQAHVINRKAEYSNLRPADDTLPVASCRPTNTP